jgi:hypothetical protein
MVTATCPATATCTAAFEELNNNSCECCPKTSLKCDAANVDQAFFAKYCNADKTFKFTDLKASCPQNMDPALRPKLTCEIE